MIKLILFCILAISVRSDCPLNSYPRKTTVGTINVQLDNDPKLHNSALEYTYPLLQEFPETVTNVAIAIIGYELNSHELIDFKIDYLSPTSQSALRFRVRVNDLALGWRSLKFNFLATASPFFQTNTLSFGAASFSTTANSNKYTLLRPIPGIPTDPVIKVFISGLALRAKSLDDQYNLMVRQYENLKQFSTSTLLKSFEQAIEMKKAMDFKLSDAKLIGKYLSLVLETTQELQSLTISSVAFSRKSLQQMHNYLADSFTVTRTNQYRVGSLQNMNMLLVGLTGSRVSRDANSLVSLSYTDLGGQTYFSLASSSEFESTFAVVAFEMKIGFACQDCANSPIIYDNKFCVQTCPRSFSLSETNGIKFCDRCDVEKIKVVDIDTGLCVCAKRYFLDSAADICRPCSYDCMTCNSADKCLTCDNSLMQSKRKLNSSNNCECPSVGYYDDRSAENIICQKCDQRCLTCNGPKPHDCLTCVPAKQLDANSFCVCKFGFLEDPSGNCYCPKALVNGICLDMSPCGPNKEEQVVGDVRRCVCKPGYISVLNECIKCGVNSVFDKSQAKCVCVKPTVEVSGRCAGCGANQVYDEVYKVCVCSNGSYKKDDGSCVTCPPKMVLVEDSCECIYNFYEASPNVCRPCIRETDGPNCKRNVF